MENYALALLRNEALWEEVGLTKHEANQPGLVRSILLHFITQSQALGGSFLNDFWLNFGKCHPKLQENIAKLNAAPGLVSENDVSAVLFNGVPVKEFNFVPVFLLAAEYFTHLGLTFMQPRDIMDAADPYDFGIDSGEADHNDQANNFAGASESAINPPETNDATKMLNLDIQAKGLSKEQILKYSAFIRDGFNCVITGWPLEYPQRPQNGFRCSQIYKQNRQRLRPNLTPIIPFLIEENPSALQCIASLAGDSVRQLVLDHLSTVDNVMVLGLDARFKFDEMVWAIEALDSTKYVYRRIPAEEGPGPLYFKLEDSSEVKFGLAQGGKGPLPALCNLRLAVTRALVLSGAARLMGILIDNPDIDTSREFRCHLAACGTASSFYLHSACQIL